MHLSQSLWSRKIAFRCGLVLLLHCLLFSTAWAGNQLTILYSGNVNGEIEGCG